MFDAVGIVSMFHQSLDGHRHAHSVPALEGLGEPFMQPLLSREQAIRAAFNGSKPLVV